MQLSTPAHAGAAGNGVTAAAPRGTPLWRSLLEILIAAGIVVLLFDFFFASAEVRDERMSPTLRAGQRVLVSRLPYRLTAPQRGDVVAVRSRIDPSRIELHRVIGLPGDALDIRGAQVSVNGLPLREPYLLEGRERLNLGATTVGRYRLGQDDYFLLNDNRADLGDSRSFGVFSRDQILGRVWLIYWPPQNIAAVAHTQPARGEP
ncbi:MAG: signal peptidase I [Anaerolineae bacterium]|nr:signal peptidase I [Candidatus Roseilinea sp.]MDW8450961.1 signal peptidase I [Anaerolineae bacterium]